VLLDHFPENVQGFGRYGVQAWARELTWV
jgi:hypothetical protein